MNWPAIAVPAAVAQHAAELDVFNFWDPQWTGVNKVLALVQGAAGPLGGFLSASDITALCSTSPVCRAGVGSAFGSIL